MLLHRTTRRATITENQEILPRCFHIAFRPAAGSIAAYAGRKPRNSIAYGAPRSMKMGTIHSPYRYDAAACHALQSVILRRPAILHYA
jgi:hypothetical protein